MNPTASQAYLALDVVASAQLDAQDPVMLTAKSIIMHAFQAPGWTGKVEGQCAEYGRQPLTDSVDTPDVDSL